MSWAYSIDPSVWLLVIVGVSWGVLIAWVGLLLGWVMREDMGKEPS